MTELLSHDENAWDASLTARYLDRHPDRTVEIAIEESEMSPWPICGDELTKRRMK